MDNYLVRLSAYLASRLSQELGTDVAESMNMVIGSDLYRMLTDQKHHHYRMSLEEAYERLLEETGQQVSDSGVAS
jgi:hypothetical protein